MTIKHTPALERAAIDGSYVASTLAWAQLARGSFDVGFDVVEAFAVRVAMRTYNLALQAEAQIEPNKSVVAVVTGPGANVRWFGSRFGVDSIATSRSAIDVRTDGPSAFFSITIDEAALQAGYPRSHDADALCANIDRGMLRQNPSEARRIRDLVMHLFTQREISSTMTRGTLVPLLASAIESVSGHAVERTKCLNRRFAAVRACESYIRDHVDSTLTLLDLSQIAGMRSRSLINAFEAVTGLSPMEYLKRLRLNGVHRALSDARKSRPRIIDVATAWGFWHMGHFATDYRTMFGEAPSETLLNSRRHFAVG